MHKRSALCAGEYSGVYLLCKSLVICEDKTASGASQGLVSGGCNDVGIGNGRLVHTCCNKSCDVGHIHHKICADGLCDLRKSLKVDSSGICGSTCNDKLGLMLLCKLLNSVIVDSLGLVIKTVGNEVEVFSRNIYG